MRHRGAGVALATLVLVAGPAARAADDAPARVIEYAHDAVTVHITKVQLDEVIAEIGRQAGAEIRGGVKSPREVTAEFDAVPLTEGLHRLLGDQNFALVYGEGGSLRAIKLLGGPLAAPAPGTTPVVAPPGPAKPYDTVGTLLNLVANHPPVAITGKLALALGAPNATIPQLVDTGLHHEDGAVRAEAIRRGLQVIEAEPELRAAVLTSLKGMDDPELATVLLGAAGPRADEVAMHVATQARASEIRIKASSVRQQLRARVGGSGG